MKLEFVNNWTERKFLLITLSSVFVFFSLLGLQGFDMCDEGWVLTGYQQIFNDPESVEYLMLYYLAQVIGGTWNLILGNYGILSFRILSALLLTIVVLVLYCFFRQKMSRGVFLLGILATLLTQSFGIMCFHHNYLTTLLVCLVALSLMRGILDDSFSLVVLAGFITGLAVFTRIPNLSMFSLLLVIMVYSYYANLKTSFYYIVAFLFGIFGGSAFVLMIMTFLGHTNIFIQAISSGLFAAESTDSTHNLSYMLGVYVSNYAEVVKCTIALFLPLLFFHLRKIGKDCNSNLFIYLFLLLAIGYVWFIFNQFKIIFIIYGYSNAMLFYELYDGRKEKKRVIPAMITLILLHCIPLGSDFGIGNMGLWSIWIALPYSIYIVFSNLNNNWMNRFYNISFLTLLLLTGILKICSQCYFDSGWRWHKRFLIESPLANTFTTKHSADRTNEILIELQKYVNKDDYVLFYQHFAMLYYLTGTRPYLNNPWPWTYDPENMEKQFDRAKRNHSMLPVLVRDKSCTGKWPYYDENWNNTDINDNYVHKNKRIMLINKFILENGYNVVWENELFQILLPRH